MATSQESQIVGRVRRKLVKQNRQIELLTLEISRLRGHNRALRTAVLRLYQDLDWYEDQAEQRLLLDELSLLTEASGLGEEHGEAL